MSSSREFVEFAAGQLAGAGEISWKRMFGEYGLYCDGLFFATICDDQLFFKPTEAARRLQPDLPLAPPYQGAKDYLCGAACGQSSQTQAPAGCLCRGQAQGL